MNMRSWRTIYPYHPYQCCPGYRMRDKIRHVPFKRDLGNWSGYTGRIDGLCKYT